MSNFSYEEFYIPDSLENNKILGFGRDDIFLFFTLIGISITASQALFLILAPIAVIKYRKYKADKFHFIPNLRYSKFYEFTSIKFMPRPFIKRIYGG